MKLGLVDLDGQLIYGEFFLLWCRRLQEIPPPDLHFSMSRHTHTQPDRQEEEEEARVLYDLFKAFFSSYRLSILSIGLQPFFTLPVYPFIYIGGISVFPSFPGNVFLFFPSVSMCARLVLCFLCEHVWVEWSIDGGSVRRPVLSILLLLVLVLLRLLLTTNTTTTALTSSSSSILSLFFLIQR